MLPVLVLNAPVEAELPFDDELSEEESERKSEEENGGKMEPNALGAVVGDGEGRVGKNAECDKVGECSMGMPPASAGPSVGVRGEIKEVRLTSGTMTDKPEAPFRCAEGTLGGI